MGSRDTNSIALIYEINSKQFTMSAHDVCKCEYMKKYFDLHMTLMWL